MYIKINELWLFKDIDCLKNASKTQLLSHIKLLSDEIDEYCNTRFEPSEDSYFRDFKERFNTRKQPLLEVQKLALNHCRLKENRHFFVYQENSSVEVLETPKKQYKKALEVKYLFGYKEVPSIVKQVIVELIKLDYESKKFSLSGLQSENWDGEYSYATQSSKDFTPTELRKNILSRLDIFKVPPFMETKETRTVKVRLL